jgi:hypothetical protein
MSLKSQIQDSWFKVSPGGSYAQDFYILKKSINLSWVLTLGYPKITKAS